MTAFFISAKFEEIYPYRLKDMVYLVDNAYTREQILEMESKIIQFFDFNISLPNCYNFLQIYSEIGRLN